jgi:hypothetical protein
MERKRMKEEKKNKSVTRGGKSGKRKRNRNPDDDDDDDEGEIRADRDEHVSDKKVCVVRCVGLVFFWFIVGLAHSSPWRQQKQKRKRSSSSGKQKQAKKHKQEIDSAAVSAKIKDADDKGKEKVESDGEI